MSLRPPHAHQLRPTLSRLEDSMLVKRGLKLVKVPTAEHACPPMANYLNTLPAFRNKPHTASQVCLSSRVTEPRCSRNLVAGGTAVHRSDGGASRSIVPAVEARRCECKRSGRHRGTCGATGQRRRPAGRCVGSYSSDRRGVMSRAKGGGYAM